MFVLNVAVALAKILFGYASGAISILSDGFHSLTDSASNVVGLVGVRAAGRPPDADHPYGHRKYETVAAAAITVFLLLIVIEVLRNAFNHLSERDTFMRLQDGRIAGREGNLFCNPSILQFCNVTVSDRSRSVRRS